MKQIQEKRRAKGDHRPVQILVQDEGRLGRINLGRPTWAPSGCRPVAPRQVVRQSLYAFVAVCPELGKLTALILPEANTEMRNLFLKEMADDFSENLVIMIVDRAAWHGSQTLEIPENIELIKQPPYSPELNPVEHIWEDLREKEFHNRALGSLDEVEEALCCGINRLADNPAGLRSMTHFPYLQNITL